MKIYGESNANRNRRQTMENLTLLLCSDKASVEEEGFAFLSNGASAMQFAFGCFCSELVLMHHHTARIVSETPCSPASLLLLILRRDVLSSTDYAMERRNFGD